MDIRPKTTKRHEFLKVSNEKILKERKKNRNRWTVIIGILFVLFLVGIIFILRIHALKLSSIQVTGNILIENKDIENAIYKNYEGKYLWVLPKKNLFFIFPKKVEQLLQADFPRINKIHVRRIFPNTLTVSLTERKGVYVWCGNATDISFISKDNPCFFLDAEGIFFSEAPYFSGTPFPLFLGGNKDRERLFGSSILDREKFKNILFIYDQMQILKLSPYAIRVLPDGESEILLRDGYSDFLSAPHVKLKDISNPILVTQNLAASLNTKIFKEHAISEFRYIDLRFGNKVFYTLK